MSSRKLGGASKRAKSVTRPTNAQSQSPVSIAPPLGQSSDRGSAPQIVGVKGPKRRMLGRERDQHSRPPTDCTWPRNSLRAGSAQAVKEGVEVAQSATPEPVPCS